MTSAVATAMMTVGVLRLLDAIYPATTSRIHLATIGGVLVIVGFILRLSHV